MNKPLKLLLVVGVLAFAAAGLYYAMVSPARSGKAETKVTRQDQSGGPKFDAGNTRPPTVVVGKEPAGSWPTPLPVEPSTAPSASTAPAAPATQGNAGAATPPGFSPAGEPMKALPNALPGFEPVNADGTPAKAAPASQAITPGAPAPNSVPATPLVPATPVGVAAPASSTSSSATGGAMTARPAPAPAPAALPTLPAPAKPAAAPAPATPASTAAPKSAADTYTVKEGDSIASIWRSISGSERGWEKMLAANPGVDPSRLKIGQVLKVPDHASTGAAEPSAAAKPTVAPGTYTIQSGDTLSRIAAKTLGDSKRWKEIYDANRDTLGNDPGALEVGHTLKIPGKAAAAKPSSAKPADAKPAEPKPVEPKPAPTPASNPAPIAPPPGVIGGAGSTSSGAVTNPAPAPTSTPAPR